MIDRDANYRILIQYTRNDGAVLGAPGDVRLFREWARILYGRFPDAESRMERDLLYYDGSSAARPQWFEQVTDSNLPVDGQYHVSAPVVGLPNARVAGDTANIEVDNSLPGQVLWDLTQTGVTPGAYTSANVTVDEFGRVIAISNGGGGGGGVTNVTATYPLASSGGATPDISADTSEGGNGAADAGKLPVFRSEGQLQGSVENSTTAAIRGISTGTGYAGHFSAASVLEALLAFNFGSGPAALLRNGNGGLGADIESTAKALSVHAAYTGVGTPDIAEFETGLVPVVKLRIGFDGSISWPAGGTGPTATLTNLGATAVGTALFTVATPAGVRFIRVNADGTITLRTAAELLADIGAQTSGSYLVTTNNLSDVANAGTARTNLGLAIGTDVQAYDADLQAISGLTSAANKIVQYTGAGTAQLVDLELGTEAAYGGTITWTAGTAPSGASNLRQFYTRVGNMVTWQISLQYASAGSTVTNLSLTFPSQFPTPAIPAGWSGANARIAGGDPLRLLTSITSSVIVSNALCISRNAADNGFVIAPTTSFTSGSYAAFILSGQYFTA